MASRECVADKMDVVIDVIDAGDDLGAVRHSKRTRGTFDPGNVVDRCVAIACVNPSVEFGLITRILRPSEDMLDSTICILSCEHKGV